MSIISSILNNIGFFCQYLVQKKENRAASKALEEGFQQPFLTTLNDCPPSIGNGKVDLAVISKIVKKQLNRADIKNDLTKLGKIADLLTNSVADKELYYRRQYQDISTRPYIPGETAFFPLDYSKKHGAIKKAMDLIKEINELKAGVRHDEGTAEFVSKQEPSGDRRVVFIQPAPKPIAKQPSFTTYEAPAVGPNFKTDFDKAMEIFS